MYTSKYLLITCLLSACAWSAEPPSVAGVRLGMTMDEARAALAAHGTALGPRVRQEDSTFKPSNYTRSATPFVSTVTLSYQNPQIPAKGVQSDGVRVIFTAPPDQRVVAIGRDTTMADPVAIETVLKQLSGKHGAVTEQHSGYWWFFDARSNRVAPPAASNVRGKYCDDMRSYMQFENRLGGLIQGNFTNLQTMKAPDPGCGIVLEVGQPTQNPTKNLRMLLMDHKRYRDTLVEADTAIRSEHARNQQQKLDGSKKNTVPNL
jgi:hypothetical protein